MKMIRIAELGRIVTGNTPPRNNPKLYGDYIPFIKATDISENEKYTRKPQEYYSKLGYEKYKNSLIPKGSTCVVTIGTVGKKMTMAHCDLFINQAINAIIPNEKNDPNYVYYLLKYNLYRLKNLDSGTASGRENISKSSFSNLTIEIIEDFQTQVRIGNILNSFDILIENNQKQIKLLEEAAQRLYKEWFVDLRFPGHETTPIIDGVPEGWSKKSINDVATINEESIKNDYSYEYIDYVDLSSVSIGRVNKHTRYQINNAPGRAKRMAHDGDIIWGMVRPNLKLYSLILHPQNTDVFSTGFAVLSAKKIPFTYLYLVVTQMDFVNYLINCTNGAAYPAVRPEHFGKAQLTIPTPSILNLFHKEIEPLVRLKEVLEKRICQLVEARDRLLPKLMNGEIEV